MAGRAADHGPQPHDEFLDAERLDEIVVRAGLEARDLVGPVVARGEDQHREGRGRLAPGLQHRGPVLLRQAEIEHDGVEVSVSPRCWPSSPFVRDVDDEILGPQVARDGVGQASVVFDEKHAHGEIPCSKRRVNRPPS